MRLNLTHGVLDVGGVSRKGFMAKATVKPLIVPMDISGDLTFRQMASHYRRPRIAKEFGSIITSGLVFMAIMPGRSKKKRRVEPPKVWVGYEPTRRQYYQLVFGGEPRL